MRPSCDTSLTVKVDGSTVQSMTYGYNNLGMLTSVSEGGTVEATYTYDVNGNRSSLTYSNGNVETYTYNLANWVTSLTNSDGAATISSFSYTYYADGNQRTKTTASNAVTTYVYDSVGRLSSETESDGMSIAYTYDRFSNRSSMTVTSDDENYTTIYVYDAANRLITETKSYEFSDEITSYDYDAFGNEKTPTANDTNPFRYCGEYWDDETGTYYLRARYYDPSIGRFSQQDPILDGLNWYAYCANSPVAYMDPQGLEQIVVSGGRYSTGSGFQYEFIETAIKQIYEWIFSGSDETISWIIADEGWSKSDKKMFSKIASDLGINLVYITDKEELFDYINDGQNRTKDPITAFTVFSHGFVSDDGVISLGYNYSDYNTKLDIYKKDIDKINTSAFENPITKFYSCNTGTSGDSSFAQAWVNKFGGETIAFAGKSDYANINTGAPWWVKILKKGDRILWGFSPTGSYNYPVAGNGASMQTFQKK